MRRAAEIPLFFFVVTAILAHLVGGGGAKVTSVIIEEHAAVGSFAGSVRDFVQGEATPTEVTIVGADELPTPPRAETAPEDDDPNAQEGDDVPDPDAKDPPPDDAPPVPKPKTPTAKDKPEPEPTPDEKKAPEEQQPLKLTKPKLLEKEKDAAKAPEEQQPLQKPKPDSRVAIRQHVKNKFQKDNPDANHIADDANHVKEETRARITSTDQNAEKPQPAGQHASEAKQPGDSDEHRVAQSEDRPGEDNKAPGEDEVKPGSARKVAPVQTEPPAAAGSKGAQDGAKVARAGQKSVEAVKGQRAQAGVTEKATAAEGGDAVTTPREEKKGRRARAGREGRKGLRKRGRRRGRAGPVFGLGSGSTIGGGINPNLNPYLARRTIGEEQLQKELVADGKRRRSAHRGSSKVYGLKKWRSAIENYVPGVKPGNTTALNAKQVPFATYLNTIHNRLHPVFAGNFLGSLDGLGPTHVLNDMKMKTFMEVVLNPEDGTIARQGITRSSGVTAFDVAALEAVQRASPYGPAPSEIVSPDGKVYLHWEFHRNPIYACSTYFAHPYILKGKPHEAPSEVAPAGPTRAAEGERKTDEKHSGADEKKAGDKGAGKAGAGKAGAGEAGAGKKKAGDEGAGSKGDRSATDDDKRSKKAGASKSSAKKKPSPKK